MAEGARTDNRCDAALLPSRPIRGGKQAVAEAWRNLTASAPGPRHHRQSEFRQSRKAGDHGQLIACIEGIGEACRALDFPVVSGNVSLYNESSGSAIAPTPAIGGVGLIEDVSLTASLPFKRPGETILLIGETQAGSVGPFICARLRVRDWGAAAGRSGSGKAQWDFVRASSPARP